MSYHHSLYQMVHFSVVLEYVHVYVHVYKYNIISKTT